MQMAYCSLDKKKKPRLSMTSVLVYASQCTVYGKRNEKPFQQ